MVTAYNQSAVDFAALRPAWRPDLRYSEIFEHQVEINPSATAVECAGQRCTYAELNQRANRVAHHLVACGVGREDVVALLLDRSIDFTIAILGVFKAGVAYMPLDPEWPEQRLRAVLAESGCTCILSAAPSLERAHDLVANAFDVTALAVANGPDANLGIPGSIQDPAYVIFTSGSTGQPKGAMLTHAGMLNQHFAKIVELGLTEADTVAQTARQTFDVSVWQFLAALLVGGRVLILPGEHAWEPRLLLDALSRERVTIFETVPTHLALLLDELEARPAAYDLKLRWIMPTGEALMLELCRRWFGMFPDVPMINAYGPTECSDDTTHCKLYEPPPSTLKYAPIHGNVGNMRHYVLDAQLEPVPYGVPGELCIGGVGVGRGYIHDPARTALAFVPDPYGGEAGARMYRTGDLARLLPGGTIEFLGRIDHQVKIRGFRIEIGEIESQLARHEHVRECVVVAREDRLGDKRLVAYVTGREGAAPTSAALVAFLAERLASYMVPSFFVILNEMPTLPNGKLDRKALPAPDVDAHAEQLPYVAPRTPVERLVCEVWSAVLGVARVGIHDDFFDLGGHSLLATQVAARLRDALQIELPLRILFEATTVIELAERLQAAPGQTAATPIVRAQDLDATHLLENIDQLSEEEMDALLDELDHKV